MRGQGGSFYVFYEKGDNGYMREKTDISYILFVVIIFVIVLLAPSCGKKEPEPLKPSSETVVETPPKYMEQQAVPPKEDVREIVEVSEAKIGKKPVPVEQSKKTAVRVKEETYGARPSSENTAPPPLEMKPVPPKLMKVDRLNRELEKYGLNVWASPWKDDGLLLNGKVKSEDEREAALYLARRYSRNITDMINVVIVHDVR